MTEILVVPTIPHTGTHSVMHLIDSEGYSKLLEVKSKKKNKNYENCFSVKSCTHNHILLWELLNLYSEELKPDFSDHPLIDHKLVNVIHGHIDSNCIEVIEQLGRYYTLIMPMRDPLLTLISTRNRNPIAEFLREMEESKSKDAEEFHLSLGASNQIDAWLIWAKCLHKLNPLYIPLDIEEKNKNVIYKSINFSNIETHSSIDPKRAGLLKRSYYEKNITVLENYLGGGFKLLAKLESILRPPLEEIGYKDLLWWS
jgi:hypothetical protein